MTELWADILSVGAIFIALGIVFLRHLEFSKRAILLTAIASTIVSLGAYLLQSEARKALKHDLTQYRWEPLTKSEAAALRSRLADFPPPTQTVNVLCYLKGCGDLAESIRAALRMPGWKIDVVGAYGNGPPNGIVLWFREPIAARIGEDLELATGGRLKVVPQKFPSDDHGQINLAIGYKP